MQEFMFYVLSAFTCFMCFISGYLLGDFRAQKNHREVVSFLKKRLNEYRLFSVVQKEETEKRDDNDIYAALNRAAEESSGVRKSTEDAELSPPDGYKMAEGLACTYQEYKLAKWTDENLIKHGRLIKTKD